MKSDCVERSLLCRVASRTSAANYNVPLTLMSFFLIVLLYPVRQLIQSRVNRKRLVSKPIGYNDYLEMSCCTYALSAQRSANYLTCARTLLAITVPNMTGPELCLSEMCMYATLFTEFTAACEEA